MARTPTEADFGLEVTEEEMAGAPPTVENDDDIGLGGDDDPAPLPVKVEPAKVDPEPPKAAEPAKADEGKTVDLRALQEARNEGREAKAQARVLEQRLNDVLAMIGGQNKPADKQDEAPTVPKFGTDPIAAGEWTQAQIVAMLDAQKVEREQTATQQREEQEFRAIADVVSQDYETAKLTDPTVDVAYNALRESQGKELLAMGYTIPQAQAELNRMERDHIKFVASRGIPIADYIKALASARGWQPSAAPTAQQPVKTDLRAVAETQQRHQSLSDAPGGEAVPPLDAKALARMSDKEFKTWMSKKGNEDRFDDIMGR